ncbi:helix-turn-helix domain-containing protein [Neobacillus jeddahensis]|uniref:helix-turn-helix domain-containing protein n=1 Tax=Neobacillus jeddahensis TaxID=1461580 RepID=UPI000ACB2802|nr:helix-turn-helix domain-containing protein [Neobacillus jeddahensis]
MKDKQKIIHMYLEGISKRDIAKEAMMSRNTVSENISNNKLGYNLMIMQVEINNSSKQT